jgi:hypothetical protein
MFTPIASEPVSGRLSGHALSIGLHAAAVLSGFAKAWIVAILATLAIQQPNPPYARTQVMLLAPPPGQPAPTFSSEQKLSGPGEDPADGAPALDESTDIVWDADYGHQLIPVLRIYHGLVVFVDPLDRVHAKAAFRADGIQVKPPETLQHYVRLRVRNPVWWPEIESLCTSADPSRALEVMAVFPPEYRSKLGQAVKVRMAEMKRAGRVVWLSLTLDASRPAGVLVRDVKVNPSHA